MSCLEALHSVPLSKCIVSRDLVRVLATTRVEEGLKVMLEHNILSVPVYDPKQDLYLGVVDMLDMVDFIVFGPYRLQNFDFDFFSKYTFPNRTMGDVATTKRVTGDVYVTSPDETLDAAITTLTKGGLHRALVISGRKEGIDQIELRTVSQSDIVRYLLQNARSLPPLFDCFRVPVKLSKVARTAVVTESSSAVALEAFRRLAQRAVNALAIVDEGGSLVATLSASDLRGLTGDKLKNLNLPVLEYLNAMRGVRDPITCSEQDTIGDVMEKAMAHKVHRVWMVNEAKKPVDVITLSDMLLVFLGE